MLAKIKENLPYRAGIILNSIWALVIVIFTIIYEIVIIKLHFPDKETEAQTISDLLKVKIH